ncbi:MAG: hypothetical protein ACREIA_19910 [Opitutaceae bacterium]
MKDFVRAAGERGVIVELNAFYVQYGDGPEYGARLLHPLNARNNINGVGSIPWHRYNTLDDARIVARQEALLRRTLKELNEFDNVFYEMCDEPYWSGASPADTGAWQNHLIVVFVSTASRTGKCRRRRRTVRILAHSRRSRPRSRRISFTRTANARFAKAGRRGGGSTAMNMRTCCATCCTRRGSK